MQRIGLAPGAPVGRVLGYQASIPAGVDSAQPVTEERLADSRRQVQDAPRPRGIFLVLLVIAGGLGRSAVQRDRRVAAWLVQARA